MFGSFAFKILFLTLSLLSVGVLAQDKNIYRGKVITPGANVYQAADFDSPILGHLPPGKIYEISKKTIGPFYRIKVSGKMGYIADNDIKPLNFKTDSAVAHEQVKEKAETKPMKLRRKRPFALTRYIGLGYGYITYTEETLGKTQSEGLSSFGLKISGPDVLIEGAATTEVNLLYHQGAPSYYQSITGQDATGFLLLSDFQFQTVSTLTRAVIGFIGFGPMLRYSKFDVGLKDPTTGFVTTYSASDAALGIDFSLGLGFRIASVALRFEAKYYWEKYQYWGAGSALQFEF